MNWNPYLEKFLHSASKDLIRYVLFAGIPYLIFYILFKSRLVNHKIQERFPKLHDIRREVFFSITSILIFSLTSVLVFILAKSGYTKIYTDFAYHSAAYFVFTVILMIVLHDTYFYWTHRFMHWKKIFRHVHLIHHKSTNPTPWAAFSFHPVEAAIQVAYFPIMVLIIPLYPAAILIWALYQFALNVGGHLGFELFPKGFTRHSFTFWHNTSTHHNMHHKYFHCNYGLYFNIWDRLMGTNHVRYNEEFDEVCERRKERLAEEYSASQA